MLAQSILAIHLLVIVFNLAGLVVIPLGAKRGWAFVRAPIWRLLHAGSWATVALQAILGQACFLTVWQADASVGEASAEPLVARWINALIYWPLPLWVFAILYCAAFAYVLILFRLVPLYWRPGTRQ